MNLTLLDTDMLSELLKQRNPAVTQRASDYLKVIERANFGQSPVVEVILMATRI